ncbi:MAG: thiol-disulfide isomerase/thioredoxin [Planctomycetota bacterium]
MVASSIDVEKESTVHVQQDVNSGSYLARHSGQMFSDGRSFSGFERNVLWISNGDGFTDVSPVSGANSPNDSRAVIAADLDDDGDVDLFVHSIQRERHALYRNDATEPGGAAAGFLKVRLQGTTGNPEGVGATVTVKGALGSVAQVLSRGAGFQSCQAPELVFGLGSARTATVSVLWPGGAIESFGVLASGSRVLLVEGTGKPEPFARRPMSFPDPLPPGLHVSVGDLMPTLRLRGSDGGVEDLDVGKLADGKPVLVNLWASYCAPCVRELPDLQAVHEQGDQRVVSICVDFESAGARATSLLERAGVTFPNYSSVELEEGSGAVSLEGLADLDRLTLPTTIVVTPDGRVDSIIRGAFK